MGLSLPPLSITSAAAFNFLEKFGIQCHRRLVEEMRIMDIEAMKLEAEENQTSGENQYSSSLSAPTAGRRKPSQEVAKKIAKAAGVKSKSMFLEMGLSDQPSNNHQITIK